MREGDRTRVRARAGLSGTSATLLSEGPLGAGRGSWLFSARRSYLDLLLKRIDDENSLAFGFTDAQAKVVFDLTPRHQVQALVIAGASAFEEKPADLGANDEARVSGRSWLTTASWRYTPSGRVAITQRLFATGLSFDSINKLDDTLDDSRSAEAGWRLDATFSVHPRLLLELGAEAQRMASRHAVRRALNDESTVTTISDFRAARGAGAAYGQLIVTPWSRLTVAQGFRIDRGTEVGQWTLSPWTSAELRLGANTRVRAAGGVYRQFAELEQSYGIRAAAAPLRPERATHVDLGLTQSFPFASTLQITWFRRDERDVLWARGAEPRLLPDGTVQLGRGDAPWVNALDGTARGLEVVIRRDSPAGFAGWAGYSYGRHQYIDVATQEWFWSDLDQRHAVSLFGHYRMSSRTSLAAKFRYGSNYPRAGYVVERAPRDDAPPLFGGNNPLFFGLSTERDTVRLPPYARLDLRADRTFTWFGRRATLFVEVANVLNRRNVRNVPYGVDRTGRIAGGTDALMPILPSAGFVIEF